MVFSNQSNTAGPDRSLQATLNSLMITIPYYINQIMGNDYCCGVNNTAPTLVLQPGLFDFRSMDYNKPSTIRKLETFSKSFVQKQGLLADQTTIIIRILGSKQEHLLLALETLEGTKQKISFLKEVESVQLELMDSLYHNLVIRNNHLRDKRIRHCDYLDTDILSQDRKRILFKTGIQAIKDKKVGLLLLAGGISVRFGQSKFLKQIGAGQNKCILKIMIIRLKRVIELAGGDWTIHICVMCNSKNFIEIRNFLRENDNFGIPQQSLTIFCQTPIPVLNLSGQIILDEHLKTILHPRGAGEFLHAFTRYDLHDKITNKLGIRYLCVSGLQNILQRPCDPLLIGSLISDEADVACKCVQPLNDTEQFLRYVKIDDSLKSVSQQVLSAAYDTQQDIRLRRSPVMMQSAVYSTLYLQTLSKSLETRMLSQSVHIDKRNFTHRDLREETLRINQECYIFQNHISDLFVGTKKISVLKVPRQQEYAPLITEYNQFSLASCWQALIKLHQEKDKNPDGISFKLLSDEEIN